MLLHITNSDQLLNLLIMKKKHFTKVAILFHNNIEFNLMLKLSLLLNIFSLFFDKFISSRQTEARSAFKIFR